MVTLTTPRSRQDSDTTNGAGRSTSDGRRPALLVVGFLVGFLPLNTYWALGGTWSLGWVLGCADCTLPLSLVWVQEALIGAGIAILLAASGIWRSPIPGWMGRVGTWAMATAFAAVGAQNLIGDNTPQASSVRVDVGWWNKLLRVEVADDGVGGAMPRPGSGLEGLADRVAALDGQLMVDSHPGMGTRVTAEIPCA